MQFGRLLIQQFSFSFGIRFFRIQDCVIAVKQFAKGERRTKFAQTVVSIANSKSDFFSNRTSATIMLVQKDRSKYLSSERDLNFRTQSGSVGLS